MDMNTNRKTGIICIVATNLLITTTTSFPRQIPLFMAIGNWEKLNLSPGKIIHTTLKSKNNETIRIHKTDIPPVRIVHAWYNPVQLVSVGFWILARNRPQLFLVERAGIVFQYVYQIRPIVLFDFNRYLFLWDWLSLSRPLLKIRIRVSVSLRHHGWLVWLCAYSWCQVFWTGWLRIMSPIIRIYAN